MPGESFQDYRARRAEENKMTAHKLRGVAVHTASIMVSGADMLRHWRKRNPDATPAQIEAIKDRFPARKFFKVQMQGTYKKEEGQ